jgi:rare lipoprotein A
LADPAYGSLPRGGYPQTYPPSVPQEAAQPIPLASANAPDVAPPSGRPAPLSADEADAGPPSSDGPRATSGRGESRYDEVGYATWYGDELAGGRTASGVPFDPKGFTAAHRTLPLGSYAEITALDTGRTILVQINDRGPRQGNLLIDLSQGAARTLGITGREAVRIRAVSASPSDLAALRAGEPGAPRLDTPPSLLAGLRQRLTSAPNSIAEPPMTQLRPPLVRVPPRPQLARTPAGKAPPPAATTAGGFYVQVAAFSSQPRATALARSLGGQAVPAGQLWRVRMGPYSTKNQASQARDAAAARGYGDARVVRQD